MSDFLRQLGCDPWLYWLAAVATGLLWLAAAALPAASVRCSWLRFNRPALFGLLLLGAMFAWRWPGILYFRPVNPDEPQFLAGALTMLARGGIWWVDPTTSGPLVVLPLALPGLLGWPVDFASGRIVATLLLWGTVMLTYLALRHVHGDRTARLLSLPLGCFATFLFFWDFLPYCSELSPQFFCALAVWLCLSAFQTDGRLTRRWRLAAGGGVLGILPFSKFQVLPLGAAIGLSAVAWICCQPGTPRRAIVRDLLVLIGSTVAGFGAMLAGLWRSGNLTDVYQSYWVHNLQYAQNRSIDWMSSGYTLHYLTGISWGFTSFHYGALGLLGIGLLAVRRVDWRMLLLGWTLLLSAYYAVLAPGRLYPHYLLLLPQPLALLVGLQFGRLLPAPGTAKCRALVLWLLFFATGVAIQVADRVWDRHTLAKLAPTDQPWSRIAGYLNQVKRPGDTLAIWGWRPELYVETQLPQATREAHTDGQLQDTPQRDYFRARFLADVRTSQPAFFVDSIGSADYGHKEVSKEGHETFPGLNDFIQSRYQLVSKSSPVRVYVRRNLLDENAAHAQP